VFANIRAISFDCFGTLIDWQTGIRQALRSLANGAQNDDLLRRFATIERNAEQPPYRLYKAVLEDVAIELAPSAPRDALWRSLPQWPAFPDTAAALQQLQRRFKIAIASNVDDDLWAATQPKLGITPDAVVTAEQVRSYKPGRPHFDALINRLALEPAQILHAGESLYHDVEPASALGFQTVWVRRVASGNSASGPGVTGAAAQATVASMHDLAALLLKS
jgi:2-haloacid dehalogenase